MFIEVFDRWGTPLFSSNSTQKPWNGADKRGFQVHDGVYFYSIKVGNKVYAGNVTVVK
ncbi:MAG: gliding motility-associated C-terminal domain-containing protein [Bacteroidia bacterium]